MPKYAGMCGECTVYGIFINLVYKNLWENESSQNKLTISRLKKILSFSVFTGGQTRFSNLTTDPGRLPSSGSWPPAPEGLVAAPRFPAPPPLLSVSQIRTRLEMEPVERRFSSSAVISAPGGGGRGCSPDTERRLGRNLVKQELN